MSCPPEEMLCSKAFVMERERYDGADVAHLLGAQGLTLDWPRIIQRLGPHVPILFSHVVLFHYIYSDGADRLPPGLMDSLYERTAPPARRWPARPRLPRNPPLAPAIPARHDDARLRGRTSARRRDDRGRSANLDGCDSTVDAPE